VLSSEPFMSEIRSSALAYPAVWLCEAFFADGTFAPPRIWPPVATVVTQLRPKCSVGVFRLGSMWVIFERFHLDNR